MQLTGHKTREIFRRYAIVSETDLREAVTKLAEQSGTKVDFESSAVQTPSTIKVHNRQHPQELLALGAPALLSGVALDDRWWRHAQEHTTLASGSRGTELTRLPS